MSIAGCPGYFITDHAGKVSAFGSAVWHGDMSGVRLHAPIIAITATPDGKGYWLLGADGGVFTFGDAAFHGSTANIKLNAPVVGMAVTTNNRGYWIISDLSPAPADNGYYLVDGNGDIYTFGPGAKNFGNA